MDNTAAYFIMILSPFLWFIMKLSVQYKMLYEMPKKKISKSFMKKAKGNIWSSFFSWKLKDRLNPFLFYFHAFLSIMVLIGIFQSIV